MNCRIITALILLPIVSYSQVRVLMPNGGERIRVGSNTVITWTGTNPGDLVTIEYSYDAGTTWNLITNNATGGFYQWNNVPNTPSSQCLLRVTTRATTTDSILIFPTFDGTTVEGLSFADISPDGKYVLGSGVEGNLYIWDSYTKQLIRKIPVADRTVVTSPIDILSIARYSPDGKYIATLRPIDGDPGNQVYLYDAKTYQLLRSWKHENFGPNMNSTRCNFSSDSRLLLVCGNQYPTIYDAATGNIVSKLHGYYDSIRVSGGWNYFIWKMLDGWWTSDMTRIIGVMTNGGTRALVLNNAATSDTIYTRDAHTGAISTHSIHRNPANTRCITTANDGNVIVFDLASGNKITTMRPYNLYPIWAEYSRAGNTFVTCGYDRFGTDGAKIMLFDASTNTYIRDVGTLGAVGNVQFNYDDSRILVSSGSSAVIFQTPTAAEQSDTSDSLWTIYFDISNTITLSIPDIRAKMNEKVSVPVFLSDPISARLGGGSKVDFTIRINATMLAPTGTTPHGTVNGGFRTIPLSADLTSNDNPQLMLLSFVAAIGNDSVTPIEILSQSIDAPSITLLKDDGSFTLSDVCYEGGARLLNPDGITSITRISPNPTSSIITMQVRTVEEGNVSIALFDILGNEVRSVFNGWQQPIDKTISVDVSTLPQGRYFLRLTTPTFAKQYPLIIKR